MERNTAGNLLENKVAVITGGARGIGYQIASTFAAEGAKVVICDTNSEVLSESCNKLQTQNYQVTGFNVDVTNSTQVDEMFEKTLDKFGRVDILINNAGITRDSLVVRMKESDWDSVIGVNLKGTFICTKAVSKIFIRQKYGKIVNIASIVGITGNAGQSNYAASKAGIIGLTKSVAKELSSRNITVNAVAPGYIQTDMTARLSEDVKNTMLGGIPMGRFGAPDDVARACLFLVSDQSSYITGQVLQVDGGLAM
jgi:3-oxoacyl-[acyl-carrier protein] reductase